MSRTWSPPKTHPSLIETVFVFTKRLSNLLPSNLTTKCWPFAAEYLERCVDQWAPSCWAITVKCRGREREPWPTIYDLFQSVAQDAWQLPMRTLGATIAMNRFVERRATEWLREDEKEKTLIREQHKESTMHLERIRSGILKGGIRTQISGWWYCSDPGVGPAELQLSQALHADSWKCQLQILWKFIAAEVSPQKILPPLQAGALLSGWGGESCANIFVPEPWWKTCSSRGCF